MPTRKGDYPLAYSLQKSSINARYLIWAHKFTLRHTLGAHGGESQRKLGEGEHGEAVRVYHARV